MGFESFHRQTGGGRRTTNDKGEPVRLNHIWARASRSIADGMACSRPGCGARWMPDQRRQDIEPRYCDTPTSS